MLDRRHIRRQSWAKGSRTSSVPSTFGSKSCSYVNAWFTSAPLCKIKSAVSARWVHNCGSSPKRLLARSPADHVMDWIAGLVSWSPALAIHDLALPVANFSMLSEFPTYCQNSDNTVSGLCTTLRCVDDRGAAVHTCNHG